MARTVFGKLKEDIRINRDGVPCAGGRLYLRGEFVSVDESIKHTVDTKAKRPPRRREMRDKQAGPNPS